MAISGTVTQGSRLVKGGNLKAIYRKDSLSLPSRTCGAIQTLFKSQGSHAREAVAFAFSITHFLFPDNFCILFGSGLNSPVHPRGLVPGLRNLIGCMDRAVLSGQNASTLSPHHATWDSDCRAGVVTNFCPSSFFQSMILEALKLL